jgi:hypothetical protein
MFVGRYSTQLRSLIVKFINCRRVIYVDVAAYSPEQVVHRALPHANVLERLDVSSCLLYAGYIAFALDQGIIPYEVSGGYWSR